MAYNFWSGMFGTSSSSSSNGLSSIYNSLGDYNSINSGSYKKLLTAYYKNTDDDSTTKTTTTTKKTTSATVNQTMTAVKKKTDALQDAAATLLETGKDSVFASED